MKNVFVISTLVVCCFCFWSFREPEQKHFLITGQTQGTTYRISYYNKHEKVIKREVDSILSVIDTSMSLYNRHSLIYKINQSADGGHLDPHFLKVIQRSIQISKETGGLFDVTVAPLVSAWGFASEKINKFPDSAQLLQILPLIRMENIRLEEKYLRKVKPDVKVDLNGIAQGYTVDVIADFFLSRGIKNFLVEVGGELRVEGEKPTGEDFYVGVEGPTNTENSQSSIKHVAIIKGKALTTSGSYNNYKKQGEKRITHIINPKTGYPIDTDILSVTVLANDAMSADGYDNALMAMGLRKALEFVNQHPTIEAYFVYQDELGNVADTMTKGFRAIIKSN